MGLSTLLLVCFIYYRSGVQALSVETQNGLTARVDMAKHVYLEKRTDEIRFEVKSCEEVNVTFEMEGTSNHHETLSLTPTTNELAFYSCYSDPVADRTSLGQIHCSTVQSGVKTPDVCSESAVFWIKKRLLHAYTVGSGCITGVNRISKHLYLPSGKNVRMELESKSAAVWKLGDSVCVPPTTAVSQPTTSTQSPRTTNQPVTTDITSPDTDTTSQDTEVKNNSQKCPATTGSDDKSSSSATRSATWLVMTSLILCQ